jgi:hypothetical protein
METESDYLLVLFCLFLTGLLGSGSILDLFFDDETVSISFTKVKEKELYKYDWECCRVSRNCFIRIGLTMLVCCDPFDATNCPQNLGAIFRRIALGR